MKKLDNHNARLKKCDVAVESDIDDTDSAEKVTIDIGIKRQQFSNEKLLENELTARIESDMSVFGMNLKEYKRKGEYGRQYIIPVGRLDLLCEDNQGNLYVVELKKDSAMMMLMNRRFSTSNGLRKVKNSKVKKYMGLFV